jgi:DNA-binding NarL/FixJ family response regulator
MTKRPRSTRPKVARVLIVDDHPAVREGLAIRLTRQPGLEVCGEADDEGQALKLVATTDPDIVIVDISLKSGSGIDLIKRIRQRDDSIRMLVWSMHPDSLYAERAMRAGAMGYINKEQATDSIVEAIRQVLAGKIYLSEPISDRLLHRAVGGEPEALERSPVEALSDRELETLQFVGQGLDRHQMAQKMHVSPKTVETYLARIKDKLGLESGRQLVQFAIQWVLDNK